MDNNFEKLNALNVSDKIEKKNNLSYLSWTWAWAEIKKKCPDVTYEVKMFDGLPYAYDEKTGYMVFTAVTIGGVTHEMWLPVMDSGNNAMKDKPYTVKTKYKEIEVAPATMFDINKTIMRCLTKNLAMFGLGLYIYAGEDLPEEPVILCEDCGGEIKPFTSAKGRYYSAKDLADGSKRTYGKALCKACMSKQAKTETAVGNE